jgi:DNA-directed RNA polymerase specialized sigma24 family protein
MRDHGLSSAQMTISDSSARHWLERLRTGDDAAAQRLWEVFFDRLVHLAHQRLQTKHRKAVDAEDVAVSAFASFCRAVEQQRFPQLSDSQELWRLLVSITVHKVLHVVRDQKRLKRGGQFRELAGFDQSSDAVAAVSQFVSREPSPEFAVEVAEEYERLCKALDDEELAQLAAWKLEGFTNDEIAAKWGRNVRTVERKLNLVRKIWLHHMSSED